MAEYDSPSHMPEGVTHNMWERLVTAHRKKVENEQKVFELKYYASFKNAYSPCSIGQGYGIAASRDAVVLTESNCRR